MIVKLLQKWGITISRRQEKLLKLALLLILVSLPSWLIIPPDEGPINVVNFGWLGRDGQLFYYGSPLDNSVLVGLMSYSLLTLLIAVLAGASLLFYLGKFLLSRGFRESEMAQSVNFTERDEREQLETMRATRRAYTVLNFILLVGWLGNLIAGNFQMALWLFVIQVIGAISFRNHSQLIKRTDA